MIIGGRSGFLARVWGCAASAPLEHEHALLQPRAGPQQQNRSAGLLQVSLKHKFGAAVPVSGTASFSGTDSVRLM